MLRISSASVSLLALASPRASVAFSPEGRVIALPLTKSARQPPTPTPKQTIRSSSSWWTTHFSATDSDDKENAYADPNYPDLEFVNYDDPEYAVDQGLGEDPGFFDEDKTQAEIEAMREERRRKNDEFQFETYHAKVLREGERVLGEWTVYQTDTFMPEGVDKDQDPETGADGGVPRLLKWDKVLKVVSRGFKIITDPNAEWRVDGERIVHEERLATPADFPSLTMSDEAQEGPLVWEMEDAAHVENKYWPDELTSQHFRGDGGIMCVGAAYTICDAEPLKEHNGELHDGPFSEMRTELGLQENGMRFRVKLDYSSVEGDSDKADTVTAPQLRLRTLTICRETLDGYWPKSHDNEISENDASGVGGKSQVQRRNQKDVEAALFGPHGASGSLYDPPPVGNEERAVGNYMLLDLPGGATLLLPHKLDQHEIDSEPGWVTSLDWTPGSIRYQVDRKVFGGRKLKGLRTLELSEVQSTDAEKYRPTDGGENMRQ